MWAQVAGCVTSDTSLLVLFFQLLDVLLVLPIVEIVAYMLAFGIGVGTVPWLLLGELCPVQVKGITSGIVVCDAYVTIFAVVKVFPSLVESIGSYGAYYLFAAVSLVRKGLHSSFINTFCLRPTAKGPSNYLFNFLFHNSHDKFDRQIIVLNQINQIDSRKSIDVVLGSNKEFVVTEVQTHSPGHSAA